MKQIKINTRITNRDSGLVDSYFNEISKYETLSPSDEIEVARRAREDRDIIAIQKLMTANLRFAVTVAKAYQSTGTPLLDLINDANEGLSKAAHRFDERKGYKFISYAVWWIKQSILSSLNKNGRIVRLPSNRVNDMGKLNKFVDGFLKDEGREPTKEEVCEVLEFKDNEYIELMSASSPVASLNRPFGEDEGSTLEDVLPTEGYGNMDGEMLNNSRREAVERIFSILPDRESDALKVEYGFGGTYEDVAIKHGISKERVRQLKNFALIKLRSKKGVNKLVELL